MCGVRLASHRSGTIYFSFLIMLPIQPLMSMKALMFAALGLFVSMMLTTMWVSNDMQRIKERERAELRATCAATTGAGSDVAMPSVPTPASTSECAAATSDSSTNLTPNSGESVDQSITEPERFEANEAPLIDEGTDPAAGDGTSAEF